MACFLAQELANQDIVRQLKLEHAKEVTKLRQEFSLQVRGAGLACMVCMHDSDNHLC